MRDYIDLGPTPPLEECAQVGSHNYEQNAKRECQVFIAQLKRQFPDLPVGVELKIKGFPHDFGTYYDVVVTYNTDDEQATRAAHMIDEQIPAYWDKEARKELGLEANTTNQ